MTASPRFWFAAALAGAALLAPSATVAQAPPPPGYLGPRVQAAPDVPPPAIPADSRQDRIEELERLLQSATAENERLQFELRQAQREAQRLQGMVNDLSAAQDAQEAAAPQRESRAAPSDPYARAGGELGTLPASAAPPPPPPLSSADAYARAREFLVGGQQRAAEEAFGAFLQAYPDAPEAPEARYWHAFTLLARGANEEAAAEFLDYLQRHQNGPRAAESMVSLGVALKAMGRDQQACAAFADVPRRYPRSSASIRDRAVREARAAGCR